MHAGSVTQIAIDVRYILFKVSADVAVPSRANACDYHPRPPIQISGDGHLDQKASVPGSGEATRFDSLEVYLVSYPGQLNFTVSAGPDLLTREQGSTVKHFDYNVSTCVPAGTYNVRPTTRRLLTATFRLLTSVHGPPYALPSRCPTTPTVPALHSSHSTRARTSTARRTSPSPPTRECSSNPPGAPVALSGLPPGAVRARADDRDYCPRALRRALTE